jgi:hypothetical protein
MTAKEDVEQTLKVSPRAWEPSSCYMSCTSGGVTIGV